MTPAMNRFGKIARAALIVLMCGSLFCNGCSNNSISEIEDLETVTLYTQSDQLANTMEYIKSLERYELADFRDKVNSGLNRWRASLEEDASSGWTLPELATTLPEQIKNHSVFTRLDDDVFFAADADFLQQSYWYRTIANRVANSNQIVNQEYMFQAALRQADKSFKDRLSESGNLLADAFELLYPEMQRDQIEQLAAAAKLFDWTIRNIYIKPALPWPTPEMIEEQALMSDPDTGAWPPATGTPGPGYTRYPWQVLTYAKGDFQERAQIFVKLCQQLDIPATILAVDAEENSSRPYLEWICAVAIGEQLYLFDTRLGLPLPGEKPGTIATLDQVVANPDLLRALDLSIEESVEKMEYPVTADMLKNLTALVVAEPESIASRMLAVENKLTGDVRLNLTRDIDTEAGQLGALPGIDEVKLWHVPYSTQMFREQVDQARITATYDPKIRARLQWVFLEEDYIDRFVMLRTARNSFLRGIFQSDRNRDVRSAFSYYYGFMYTDEQIRQLDQDRNLQLRLGILQSVGQDFNAWRMQLEAMKNSMGRVRADASYFMAMSHYENGYPDSSQKWLDRVSDFDDDGHWAEYTPYHQGRAHEASGNYDEAAVSFGEDQSAQRHGSLIRKRWMEQLKKDSATGS